jgi:transposase
LRRFARQKPRDERTRRYFIDGTHPVWGVEWVHCRWLLCGQRFHVGVGGGRKRLNILGAICPEDHEYLDVRVSKDNLNAERVIELFKKLRTAHPEVRRFVIYLDNARYHHAKMVSEWVQEQKKQGVVFQLEFLPPYSPNLNLIERLWKFLKKHALSDWHRTFEAMQQAVANVLDNLKSYGEELKTLLRQRFQLWPEEAWAACPTE